MAVLAGPRWSQGCSSEYWVIEEKGTVLDEGEGAPPGGSEPVVLLDGLRDAHCHIGDAFLRGRDLPRDLGTLVSPGGGYKHQQLSLVSPQTLRAGMEDQLNRMAVRGTVEAWDFREQGVPGLESARAAARASLPVRLILLGRPDPFPWGSSVDLEELLEVSDGIGAPSVADWGVEPCRSLAEASHRQGKPFAIHASEAVREPMEEILGLGPDLLVHLCAATRADVRLVAEAEKPVAVCPTSNAFFGIRPPVESLEAENVPWFLGTDNAMYGGGDLLREAAALAGRVPDASLLRALTASPTKAFIQPAIQFREGEARGPLVVLPRRRDGSPAWQATARVLER